MRLVSCRFAAVLPILTFSVLALAQGTTPSQTNLLGISPGAQTTFAVSVRAGTSVQPPFPRPTGTVTIYNGTTAIGSPTALSANSGFTSASFAQVFGMADASVAAAAGGAVWGDFKEDGLADLLVYGASTGNGGQPGVVVQDFVANALHPPTLHFPSFTPLAAQQLALPLPTQTSASLAVLDVDGDGHLDLLAGNTVAYGNGDGTFGRVAVLPALATGYNQTYAADIDSDGKMDIVAVDTPPAVTSPGTVQYAFSVFHNAGGGNFTALGPFQLAPPFAASSSVAYNIFGLNFADINGDGRLDVLSESNAVPVGNAAEPAALNVMLNLGTGFGPPQSIDTSAILDEGMVSIAFTDLNHDGKQDLLFSYQTNTMNNGVATLLGNGDGTFGAPVDFTIASTLTAGSAHLPLVTEDIDADGNPDVVLGSGVLLMGKGDGTLTAGTPLFTSTVAPGNAPPAYALLTAPATASIPRGENDPFFALVFVNLSGSNAVFIPNIGSGAEPTAKLMPGTYSLTAHYSGDATYAASVSSALNLTVLPFGPRVSVTSSANPSYTGENVTFTATIAGFPANPLSGSAGTVAFSDGETALGTAPVSGGAASFTTSFSSTGNHTITAAYSGDATNLAASGTVTQTVDAPIALDNGDSTSLTVAAGQSVTTQVSVKGVAGFGGTVNFSCTGLPMNAACSFAPASVTVSGAAAATTTLTVSTEAAPTVASVREGDSSRSLTVLACGLSLLGLLALVPVGRARRRLLCLGFALIVSMTSLTGCGGGSNEPKTAAGTYSFNVVATSGSATSTATYKLTVQ
jgi:hypothetical protein